MSRGACVSLLDGCDKNAANGAVLTARPRLHWKLLLAGTTWARDLFNARGAAAARGSPLRPAARQAWRNPMPRRVQQRSDRSGLSGRDLVRRSDSAAAGANCRRASQARPPCRGSDFSSPLAADQDGRRRHRPPPNRVPVFSARPFTRGMRHAFASPPNKEENMAQDKNQPNQNSSNDSLSGQSGKSASGGSSGSSGSGLGNSGSSGSGLGNSGSSGSGLGGSGSSGGMG